LKYAVRPVLADGDGHRDLGWLAQRLGNFHFSPGARAIAAYDETTAGVVGMVGYDGFTQNSAQVHIALARPHAWWALARPTFKYPFEELKKGVLLAMVSSSNERSLRLTAGVGFRETHRIRDGVLPGVDMVLFEMRPEECRWLEG
jgi:RimJ/RimL family protein N-acetyltransferase